MAYVDPCEVSSEYYKMLFENDHRRSLWHVTGDLD